MVPSGRPPSRARHSPTRHEKMVSFTGSAGVFCSLVCCRSSVMLGRWRGMAGKGVKCSRKLAAVGAWPIATSACLQGRQSATLTCSRGRLLPYTLRNPIPTPTSTTAPKRVWLTSTFASGMSDPWMGSRPAHGDTPARSAHPDWFPHHLPSEERGGNATSR